MRPSWAGSALVLCWIYACTSTSTVNSPGASAGSGGATAGSGGIAGQPSAAGASAWEGGDGGTAPEVTNPGTGGKDVSEGGSGTVAGGGNGTMTSGGAGNTAGGPSEAGAGGSAECYDERDCANPHPPTCTTTCNDGVCELRPSQALNRAIQSGPKDSAPRGGFWDAQGNAYLVYPTITTTPLSVHIQALDSDGALSGPPKSFFLPEELSEVDMVAAGFRDGHLGLLWHGAESNGRSVTQFSVTDLGGASSPHMVLKTHPANNKYPDRPYGLYLEPRALNYWGTLTYTGTGPRWRAYVAQPDAPPTDPAGALVDLPGGPVSVAGVSIVRPTPQAAALVGDTLFVTGYDCEWADVSTPCEPNLVFARYDRETFARLSEEHTTLSTTSYPMADEKQRPPVLARLGDKLAATWTQYSSAGELLLGRAVFDTDGAISTARVVQPSDLIPKALVESPRGGALLIAAQVGGAEPESTYTLVAQRLDANLAFVGNPHPLTPTLAADATNVQLFPSTDGRVLLSFRQGYAQHRILHADLCQ